MTPLPSSSSLPRPRGLWLSKELPFPLDAGDRVYSGHLARALADAGADVTFVGFPPDGGARLPPDWPLKWQSVTGKRDSAWRGLLSHLPLVAACHATRAYRWLVEALAWQRWDFVVFDNYAMAWALDIVQASADAQRPPTLVFIAHDHAETLTRTIYREYSGPLPKRLALWLNHLKTRWLERKVARNVDIVSVITPSDADTFARIAPNAQIVVLKPGFTGHVDGTRSITAATPRRVVMVGSFLWVAKQENLRRFVRAADPAFAAHGIEFHVLGKMPPALKQEIEQSTRATHLHGFVEDVAPHFRAARIAVVPEVIGGGFKMKILDYLFGRVPVAALRRAAEGLPAALTDAMLCDDEIEEMVATICAHIDRTDALDAMQQRAFEIARALFRWQDRGASLLALIRRDMRSGPQARPQREPHAAHASDIEEGTT